MSKSKRLRKYLVDAELLKEMMTVGYRTDAFIECTSGLPSKSRIIQVGMTTLGQIEIVVESDDFSEIAASGEIPVGDLWYAKHTEQV